MAVTSHVRHKSRALEPEVYEIFFIPQLCTCFAMSFVVEDPKSKLNGCARRKSAQRKTQVGAYKKKVGNGSEKSPKTEYYLVVEMTMKG